VTGTGGGFFGLSTRRRRWETEIEVPIGKPCAWCEEAIIAGDSGTVNWLGQILHTACNYRAIAGSVGHQTRRCHCFGGTEEDPPGLTRQQAAVAAMDFFLAKHGQ